MVERRDPTFSLGRRVSRLRIPLAAPGSPGFGEPPDERVHLRGELTTLVGPAAERDDVPEEERRIGTLRAAFEAEAEEGVVELAYIPSPI